MNAQNAQGSNLNYVKITGIFYSLVILFGFLPRVMFDKRVIFRAEDPIQAMSQFEQAFRFAIAADFIMYTLVLMLSWGLYKVLKPVHKGMALMGFAFRSAEAILGFVTLIFYIMPLVILSNADYLGAFNIEQLRALAILFIKSSGVAYYILLPVMGVGAVIYCYLFYKSNYVPKALAIWGMVTYITMIGYGVVNVAMVDAPKELQYAMYPGALFELLFGLWLFFKGIKTKG
ncbi:DUF4386 domain-containing protein [Pseudoalteromonas byunsanensis]|uniref:DUF4386 domain-containing protein n=1 Tax=Pseudoalteromonas byunsanensis TaxID=327939 RepID=A0A1S1N2A3_9GAMM|nr:DUF4386 domain-containing protein [Pseudoalteromonas byunsanensis]OHU93496.1 hypothetical protein BIW53_19270 [Pseudoalteromonas byunsanensis]